MALRDPDFSRTSQHLREKASKLYEHHDQFAGENSSLGSHKANTSLIVWLPKMTPSLRLKPSVCSPSLSPHCPITNYRSRCNPLDTGCISARFASSQIQDAMQQMPAQPSQKSRLKSINVKDLPSDIGLLPNLFIFPYTNGAAPQFFSKDAWKRIKLELFYLREQTKSIFA